MKGEQKIMKNHVRTVEGLDEALHLFAEKEEVEKTSELVAEEESLVCRFNMDDLEAFCLLSLLNMK